MTAHWTVYQTITNRYKDISLYHFWPIPLYGNVFHSSTVRNGSHADNYRTVVLESPVCFFSDILTTQIYYTVFGL